MSARPEYAFMIQPVTHHGVPMIRAYVVRVTDDGKFRNPGYDWPTDDAHLSEFIVGAYFDKGNGTFHGFSADYRDAFSVDVTRAEGMVKLLRKVTRGMDKLNDSEGYVSDSDYARYLLRVAKILGIKTFYVRNDRSARDRSGERWRKVAGSGVQYYVDVAAQAVSDGNVSTYDN